ncbi:WD40-repeat-containing domain protein [Flammula alnicola]|nr:WD40-repeat-containing domain protein [Flammula alnicola]
MQSSSIDRRDEPEATSSTSELLPHGSYNTHLILPHPASTSLSESQTLYIPIASPPTPAPSPGLVGVYHNHGFPTYTHPDVGQPTLLPLPFFDMNVQDPVLRRQYLFSLISSCTSSELLYLSQAITPLLQRDSTLYLPEELVVHILSYVDEPKTLMRASQVSKHWHRIVRDESLWKSMCVIHEFDDWAEAQAEWRRKQRRRLEKGKSVVWGVNSIHHSQNEDLHRQRQAEGGLLNSSPSTDSSISDTPRQPPHSSRFSFRRFFRDSFIIRTNWRSGGKLLNSHRLPIVSPDSGTVTSFALDQDWVVVGLANSQIKVFSARTGVLSRTLVGHDSGVWGVCLVSEGSYRLPDKTAGEEWGSRTKKKWKGQDKDKSNYMDKGQSKDKALQGDSGGSKGVHTLSARMGGLDVGSSHDGTHVMPSESLEHLIPPAMQIALGLDPVESSDSSHETESSSEGVFDEDAADRADLQREKKKKQEKEYYNYHHLSEEDEEEMDGPDKPLNMCNSSQGWGQPNPLIVSGGCDKVVRVWDAKSGQCIYVLHGHISTIRSLRVLNNRPIAVTGSRDATLRVWDVQLGRCLRVLEGHHLSVRCLDVFGDRVVSGSYDNTCRLWNIDTGECLHVLAGHFSQIYSVAFDGVRIASGGLDTTVRIWDAETGQCVALLQGHTALVCQLQLSPTILATGGSDGRVITFSLATYTILHRIAAHDSSVTSLQFDDNFLVTGGNDGRVRLFETQSGNFVRELSEPSESVWKVGFVKGTCAVMCKRAGKTVVEIWSLNSSKSRRSKHRARRAELVAEGS